MKTLTEKYNGVLNGTFSKDQFLRDTRMQQPNLVTQHNSYQDAVNILLSKELISEITVEKESDDSDTKLATGIQEVDAQMSNLQTVEEGPAQNNPKIEKLVAGINALIAQALDIDGDPIGVIEPGTTWEEPYTYSPIEYRNGALKITSQSVYGNKPEVEVIPARNMELDGLPTLQLIMRMYKKAVAKKVAAPSIKLAEGHKVSKDAIQVSQLKKGDVLTSGAEIVSISAGAKTPAGKMDVTVKYPNGKEETKQWGKTTKVVVKPKEKVEESLQYRSQANNEIVKGDEIEHIPSGVQMRVTVVKPNRVSGVILTPGVVKGRELKAGDVGAIKPIEIGAVWKKVTPAVNEDYEIPKPLRPLNTLDHGIRFELSKKGLDTDCTVADYMKAKTAAIKNLEKDLMHYRKLEGASEMPSSKTDQMVKVKLKEGIKYLIRKVLTEGEQPKKTFTLNGKLK